MAPTAKMSLFIPALSTENPNRSKTSGKGLGIITGIDEDVTSIVTVAMLELS